MLAGRRTVSAPASPVPADRPRASLLTYVALLALAAAAWGHLLWMAMTADDMSGMDMSAAPSAHDGAGFVAAWGVMMAAMMLPSALPMIGLYAATQRPVPRRVDRATRVAVFTLVYIVLWAATGIPIYLAGVVLDVSASGGLPYGVAAALLAAGLFQLSPLKRACLQACRSPLGFLLGHWRPGWWGSLRMGGAHAAYCLGCCWALMVVLVAAGAMGLAWVLLIAAGVAGEKLLPGGERIARGIGIGLLVLGLAVLARPDLAAALRASGHGM